MDNFQFVSQLAQFSQLQQTQTMNDQMTNLLAAQSAVQATSLLGRTVDFSANGNTISGVVKAISFSKNGPELTILTADGQTIANFSVADVAQVR